MTLYCSGLGECDGAKAGGKGPTEGRSKRVAFTLKKKRRFTQGLYVYRFMSVRTFVVVRAAVRCGSGAAAAAVVVVVWQCGRGAAVVRQRCGRGAVTVRWRRGGDVSSAAALRQRRRQRCGSGACTVSCPVAVEQASSTVDTVSVTQCSKLPVARPRAVTRATAPLCLVGNCQYRPGAGSLSPVPLYTALIMVLLRAPSFRVSSKKSVARPSSQQKSFSSASSAASSAESLTADELDLLKQNSKLASEARPRPHLTTRGLNPGRG